MRRPGCLAVLVVAAAVIAGGGLVGDVVLEGVAERRLASEVDRRVAGTSGVAAEIDSFPFLGRIVLRSEVRRVTITARKVDIEGFAFSDVKVVANDVVLDTSQALRGRVQVEDIGDGTASAALTEDQVNSRLPPGFHVELEDGAAKVSAPAGVNAELVPGNGSALALRAGGQRVLTIPIPRFDLVPCRPEVSIVSDRVVLSCSFDRFPNELKDVIS